MKRTREKLLLPPLRGCPPKSPAVLTYSSGETRDGAHERLPGPSYSLIFLPCSLTSSSLLRSRIDPTRLSKPRKMTNDITLTPVNTVKNHPAPSFSHVSPVLRSSYSPSRDGTDSNLLVFFHGLGASYPSLQRPCEVLTNPLTSCSFRRLETAFFPTWPVLKPPSNSCALPTRAGASPVAGRGSVAMVGLVRSARRRCVLLLMVALHCASPPDCLPAVISRCIPAVIRNPNPSATLHLLTKVVRYLTAPLPSSATPPSSSSSAPPPGTGLGWSPSQIHLFGYAQGGSCAAEFALSWSRSHPQTPLGSVVAVSAPLLSHPTLSQKSKTKVALVYRKSVQEEREVAVSSWKKGFEVVKEIKLEGDRGREGMPRGMDEWREIMRYVLLYP
jgi:hypothetical protein